MVAVRLAISENWRVDLSFRNRTRVTLFIVRPHVPGGTYFGLEPFRTSSWREVLERAEAGAAKPRTIAERFKPALPRRLPSGGGWSGEFSGPVDSQSASPSVLFSGDLWLSDSRRPQSFPRGSSVSRSGSSASVDCGAIQLDERRF